MLHASAVLDLAAALDDELDDRGGTGLLADVELPAHRRARPHGAGRHRGRPRPPHRARGGLRRPGARRGRGGVRRGRQGGQPRFAQAAPGDPLRRARHAQDQAHQDRLHHRRRRAPGPLREDRSPVPRAPARAPRRDPAAPDRGGTAQDGGRRRPHPHDVQPADRGDRPALQHRPQPAEHPGPHRGRPPHPRGLRGRQGLLRADDGRLLPDRDAHHGAPLRGRRHHRGVPLRPRLPLGDRGPGVRRGSRRTSPARCAPRSRR